MRRYNITILIALIAFLICPTDMRGAAKTATQIMNGLASRIKSSSSVSASFTISGASSASGTVVCSGKRFKISGTSNVWYDGKTMWVLNPRTKEMTVSTPTAEDVAQSNPLSYISGWSALFTASFPPGAKNANTVYLTSKTKKSSVKGAVITLSQGIPVKLVITANDGSKTSIVISSFKTGKAVGASTFSGKSASQGKGIKVVDLR